MVSAVVDRGNGGPWEWRTPGMADQNRFSHFFYENSRIFLAMATGVGLT